MRAPCEAPAARCFCHVWSPLTLAPLFPLYARPIFFSFLVPGRGQWIASGNRTELHQILYRYGLGRRQSPTLPGQGEPAGLAAIVRTHRFQQHDVGKKPALFARPILARRTEPVWKALPRWRPRVRFQSASQRMNASFTYRRKNHLRVRRTCYNTSHHAQPKVGSRTN